MSRPKVGTQTIVERAAALYSDDNQARVCNVLDIGTGSGCILISPASLASTVGKRSWNGN